jgi:tRNA(Phe) wybutosine-synthesizing methylase Tyw3
MRHEGISVLQRYLKQTNLDNEEAYRRAGPVDNMCVGIVVAVIPSSCYGRVVVYHSPTLRIIVF